MDARKRVRRYTTISLSPKMKKDLDSFKLSDGEESWDHLLARLFRIAKSAEEKGLLQELAA